MFVFFVVGIVLILEYLYLLFLSFEVRLNLLLIYTNDDLCYLIGYGRKYSDYSISPMIT